MILSTSTGAGFLPSTVTRVTHLFSAIYRGPMSPQTSQDTKQLNRWLPGRTRGKVVSMVDVEDLLFSQATIKQSFSCGRNDQMNPRFLHVSQQPFCLFLCHDTSQRPLWFVGTFITGRIAAFCCECVRGCGCKELPGVTTDPP